MDLASPRTIGELVALAADRLGDKPAFRMPDGRHRSYREIADRSRRLGHALRALGLATGDRVAMLSRNRIECMEIYFSSMSRLVPVPLNWRLSERELAVVLADCAPRVIFADDTYRSTVDAIKPQLPSDTMLAALDAPGDGWRSYDALVDSGAGAPEAEVSDPDDTACIIYTSGTTGRPKGVELTHRGLLLNCRAGVEDILHLGPDDIGLTAMPLFHVGGMWYHVFPGFAAGSTTTLVPEFNAQETLRLMQQDKVSHIHLVPTMLHALVEQPNVADFDLSCLRLIFYAGSSIPIELLRRATRTFAHCDFVQGYGSTEAGMVAQLDAATHKTADQRADLLQSCGRPLTGIGIRIDPIAGEDGAEIGEILIKSQMAMRGYWRNPKATIQAFDDGWLRTGDVGRLDSEGYLSILDRRNDMIVTGGENVFPREVEDVLLSDPAVAEAAVFDLPDPVWVQRVVAAVVMREGYIPDQAAMLVRLKAALASYKCPKQIFFTQALPKNGAGKVLRKVLREQFSAANGNG